MTLTSQMFNLKAIEAKKKKKITVSDHLFANSSALTVCSPHNAANTAGGGVNEDREQQQKKQKYKHWMLRLTGQTVAGKQ